MGTKSIAKKDLKRYWKALEIFEEECEKKVYDLEKLMAKETGIEDIMFVRFDNKIVGIGNVSRTMRLLRRR